MGWERWSTFGNVPERPRRGIRQLQQKRKHALDLVHENYDWQKSGGKKAPPSPPAKGKAKGEGEGEASRRGKRILDIHCVPPAPHGGRGRRRKHARLFSRLSLTSSRAAKQSRKGRHAHFFVGGAKT